MNHNTFIYHKNGVYAAVCICGWARVPTENKEFAKADAAMHLRCKPPIPKQNLVRRFMEHFGQRVPATKTLPPKERRQFRHGLFMEEAMELEESWDLVEADSLVAYLDAVCDMLYVAYGAAVEAGFNADTIDQAFLEVHRSNMSKLWTDKEKTDYAGSDLTFEPRFDKWIAKRGGKVIKSPSYSPAQLERYCQ